MILQVTAKGDIDKTLSNLKLSIRYLEVFPTILSKLPAVLANNYPMLFGLEFVSPCMDASNLVYSEP